MPLLKGAKGCGVWRKILSRVIVRNLIRVMVKACVRIISHLM
jgi:hypothetical protein